MAMFKLLTKVDACPIDSGAVSTSLMIFFKEAFTGIFFLSWQISCDEFSTHLNMAITESKKFVSFNATITRLKSSKPFLASRSLMFLKSRSRLVRFSTNSLSTGAIKWSQDEL